MRFLFVHPLWYFIGRDQESWLAGTFADAQTNLLRLRPGASDAIAHALARLGQDAEFVVYGSAELSRLWARERGVRWRRGWLKRHDESWFRDVLGSQIRTFQPDVIVNYGLLRIGGEWLRETASDVQLIGWLGSERVPALSALHAYDLVLTLAPKFLSLLAGKHIPAEYMPAAFDDRVLEDVQPTTRDADVVFVGSYGRQWGAGLRNIEAVAEATGMRCYGDTIADLPSTSPIRRHFMGPCWGLNLYRTFAAAKIVFNRHGDAMLDPDAVLRDPATNIRFDDSGNMRLYEATGMGALVVTERASNLAELFEPGVEVVTYESAEDAIDKIRFYLAHPADRERIAAAGRRRTLAEHTYSHRARRLLAVVGARAESAAGAS